MNWIKQNSFLSTLIGGTLVLCGLLTFVAMNGGSKYQDAKSRYDDAYAEVDKAENLPLYPSSENRQAKIKALDDYQQAIDELRGFYSKYQLDPSVQITTQQFTERLKAAREEVRLAFEATDSKLPADFFMGFEAYSGKLANSGSTALLDYQVNAMKHLLLGMAEARPSELIRIHREAIPEESGKPYEPFENEPARKFSYEIVFKGSEASVRDFITKLGEKDSYYCVIRSMRINNERETPPKISDAKFEKAPEAAAGPAGPFGAFFDDAPAPAPAPEVAPQPEAVPEGAAPPAELPPAPEDAAAAPQPAAPAAPAAPAPVVTDTSRILYQVLGDEELQVFVRFDILLFFPTKETTKP
jgi:hypothetical protein